ncbi:MAG: hypothetical protein PUK59_02825 [Actinomycetaceae bacterium]|nr:hypothetical protein [Actinomycetaceae bacterium]MDY5855365.1 hypothetical protein [Arcanobacterium sp.]
MSDPQDWQPQLHNPQQGVPTEQTWAPQPQDSPQLSQQSWPQQQDGQRQGMQQAGSQPPQGYEPREPIPAPPNPQLIPQQGTYPGVPALEQSSAQPPTSDGGKRRPKHKGIVALIVAIVVAALAVIGLLIAYFMPDEVFGGGSESAEQKAARLYTKVLDEIDSYEFVSEEMLSNSSDYQFSGYRYTLAEITGDDSLELIVQTDSQMLSTVRVFSADVKENKIIAPAETLQIGVAGAGGFRGGITGAKDGKALYYTVYNSGTGQTVTETITVSDGKLTHAQAGEYRIDQEPAEIKDARAELDFVPISDRSLLEQLAAGELTESKGLGDAGGDGKAAGESQKPQTQPAQPSEEELKQQAIDDARAAGKQVFTGTVRLMDIEQLIKWKLDDGLAEMNCGPDLERCVDDVYAVLLFDSPQDVEAINIDHERVRRENKVGLSLATSYEPEKLESWRTYDGQVVTVSLSGDKMWWQSDSSFPTGLPRAYNADVQVIWTKK